MWRVVGVLHRLQRPSLQAAAPQQHQHQQGEVKPSETSHTALAVSVKDGGGCFCPPGVQTAQRAPVSPPALLLLRLLHTLRLVQPVLRGRRRPRPAGV